MAQRRLDWLKEPEKKEKASGEEAPPEKPKKKKTEQPKQEKPREKATDVMWENLQKKKRL